MIIHLAYWRSEVKLLIKNDFKNLNEERIVNNESYLPIQGTVFNIISLRQLDPKVLKIGL